MDELQRRADEIYAAERADDDRTAVAADALVALYGAFNAEYVARVFSAGWLTAAERKAFAPLVAALEERQAN